MPSTTLQDLVRAVQAHAIAHYDIDNWAHVVDGYSTHELTRLLSTFPISTEAEAIQAMASHLALIGSDEPF